MENQVQRQISLEKHQDTYKLIIPSDVEKKIRHLCNRVHSVEWSGTLFYTYSGTYEDGTLEIRCVDIFPMDIGKSAYTEFDMSPDVIAYMTDHPELLDCQVGLIHSHNNMATFFSNTDLSTLREEGNDRNHFVSLIVNNEGTYTAAITRRIIERKVTNTTFSYKTFDNIEKTGTRTTEVEEEVIAYNMLDIIKEGEVVEPFLEIDERLNVIRKNKDKVKKASTPSTYYPFTPLRYSEKGEKIKQPTLFDEDFLESEPPRKVELEHNFSIPASTVKSITLQLLTGSIAIADVSRIDPVKWAGQMEKLFDKRFDNNIQLFDLWAEIMVEFVLTNFIPDRYARFEEEYISELSQEIYMAMDNLPQNKYIKSLQSSLLIWMK